MVAIKIQSLEDIVEAYLQNLGFCDNKLKEAVTSLVDCCGEQIKSEDVLASLDSLLLKSASAIFKSKNIEPEQKLAQFKLVFLLNDGALKWPPEVLWNQKAAVELAEVFRQFEVRAVPEYKLMPMAPQVIETPQPQKALKRILKHKAA